MKGKVRRGGSNGKIKEELRMSRCKAKEEKGKKWKGKEERNEERGIRQ